MPDVFISHSSKDAELADRLCAILEENGLECWMAPRNIMPGDDWAGAITRAIKSSKAFLIIYSENSVNSTQVPKEIMLAGGNGSYIIPYRIDNTPLKENYEYHLGTSHWIQADVEKGVFKGEELVEAVNKGIGQATVNVHISVENTMPIHITKKTSKLMHWLVGIGIFLLLALIVTIILLALFSNNGEAKTDDEETNSKVTQDISDDGDTDGGDTDEEENKESEYVSAPQDVNAYDSRYVDIYNDNVGKFTVLGQEYNYGYVFMNFDSYLLMDVSEYDSISFTIGALDDSGTEENQLKFFLDGEEQGYYTAHLEGLTDNIEIDLTNTDVLRFQVDGNGACCYVAMFDIQLKKSAEKNEEENVVTGEDILASPGEYKPFDVSMAEVYKNGKADFGGDSVNGFEVQGKHYDDGYVFYNMGGRLLFNTEGITQIKFSAGRLDGSSDESNKIFVYVDGVEYDWYSVGTDGITKDITIDLDGYKHIVRIFTEGNGASSQVCIFDMTVKKESEPEEFVLPEGVTASPDNIEPYFTTKVTTYDEKATAFSVDGTGVFGGYVFDCVEAGALFNVYGFNKVTMNIGMVDGSNFEKRTVYFYVDGYEVECITLEPGTPSKEIEIDLHSNSKTLYIFSEGNVNKPQIAVYNMYFTGEKKNMSDVFIPDNAFTIPENVKAEFTGEITAYNGKGDLFTVSGEKIEVGYLASKYYDSSISIDTNGKNSLFFNVGVVDEKDDYMLRFRKFSIYVDGEEVAAYNIGTAAGIQQIDVAVSGAEKVEIKLESGNVEKASLGFFNMYLS